MLTCGWDLVHLAMAMLKTTGLRFEGFKFRNAEATKAGYTSGSKLVFLQFVVEKQWKMVPAN